MKFLFNRVITACKSVSPNEFINSSVVGMGDEEGAGVGDNLLGIAALRAGDTEEDGMGDCPNPFAVIETQIAITGGQANRDIVQLRFRAYSLSHNHSTGAALGPIAISRR